MVNPVRKGSNVRPIRHDDLHAAAVLFGVDAGRRHAIDGHESQSRQACRVQGGRKLTAIQPRRADPLERPLRPAADAQVRRLQQADAGIKQCGRWAAHVRRRIHPGQSGGIEQLASPPARTLDHFEIDSELALGDKHLRQFTDRHAVPDRQRMPGNERFAARIGQGPVDRDAANRIRADPARQL